MNTKAYDKLQAVQAIPHLWNPLTADERTMMLKSVEIKFFEKDCIIYQEKEHPVFLYCLILGKVKISKGGVIGGHKQIIRAVKPGGLFGYRAYFAEEEYKTTAAVFEDSVVLRIPLSLIERLVMENAHIARFLIRDLAIDLGNADTLTISLTQKHVRGRLAETLVFLEENYGLEEDGSTLSVYMSRDDLACMSNMTTSNAIRTLSAFVNDKVIATDGRKIKIISDGELRKIAQYG